MTDTLITSIKKNKLEETRIMFSNYKGNDLANVGVWFRADDGEMRPGKAGLAFRLEQLPAFIAGLVALKDDARARKLIVEELPDA